VTGVGFLSATEMFSLMGGIPEKLETSWVDRHLYSYPQTLLQGKKLESMGIFFLIVVDVVGREQHNRLNGGGAVLSKPLSRPDSLLSGINTGIFKVLRGERPGIGHLSY
jgi:hypothetical protein